ncbi:helix-turn-helix domain-containing protein [Rhizobium sp. S96]|uniref:helix-turn-helix transcriptional regulator n=1 Tax=Rhizobium sp. S96 TaxID=3055140 RepID=UPI00339D0B3F
MSNSDGPGGPDNPGGFYNTKDVCRLLGVCRGTLIKMVKAGLFKKPFKFYRRGHHWAKDYVHDWIRQAGR